MMTLKPTDIFFSHTSIMLLAFLVAGAGVFFVFKLRDKASKPILIGLSAFVALIVAFLTLYAAPASKEASFLYKELQKTTAIANVLNRIVPGSDLEGELNMLVHNQIPNNRLAPIPNNHMKILRREFGTPDQPVLMATPKQLESYIKIVNQCFDGPLQEDLYAKIKTLPINPHDLQRALNNSYERFLNENDRRPHSNGSCHSTLMNGNAIPMDYQEGDFLN